MHLLVVVIVVGTVMGLFGRYLAHGDKVRVPALPPIMGGIAGLLLGWNLASRFGDSHGLSVGRLLMAIVVAATVSAVASIVHGHNSSPVLYVGRPEDSENPSRGR
jgi:uncharacterized membrane protein YeaQ/YmgE (transglycosylase-associated protein family)